MKITRNNIKELLNISVSTYDTQIEMLIPQLIESICEYCRNDFILYGRDGHVYDNADMVITENTITLSTDIPISAGDFIRLYGTDYNDSFYQVYSYSGGVIVIESTKEMRSETATSAYIALVEFPSVFLNIISDYVKNNVIRDGTVKTEKIDDTNVEYFSPFNSDTFIKHNSVMLNKHRKVFKEEFFDVFSEVLL